MTLDRHNESNNNKTIYALQLLQLDHYFLLLTHAAQNIYSPHRLGMINSTHYILSPNKFILTEEIVLKDLSRTSSRCKLYLSIFWSWVKKLSRRGQEVYDAE